MKRRSPRITSAASDDLLGVWLTIASDSPAAADRMTARLRDRIEDLGAHPGVGHARDDISPGLRASTVGSYLVLHRIVHGRVIVSRVLHGARDAAAMFEEV